MKEVIILGADGKPMKLNNAEQANALRVQKITNALGADINITALTTVIKKVAEQKFFEIPFAKYVPLVVGEGAFSSVLTRYRSFDVADDFEAGDINNASNRSRLETVGTAVDALNFKVKNWAKEMVYSVFEVEEASKANNWNYIEANEKARKRNWDLGLQKIAFLGHGSDLSIRGLLNLTGVQNNTSVITKAIGVMTATELKAFANSIISAYRVNCNYTAYPTHFVIPEGDWNALGGATNPDYPLKSLLEYLKEVFSVLTQNTEFKILPAAYCDATNNKLGAGGVGLNRYVLYRSDEDTLRMDLPVDYTSTMINTFDGFRFANVAYGQYTGVNVTRPKEVLYFSRPA